MFLSPWQKRSDKQVAGRLVDRMEATTGLGISGTERKSWSMSKMQGTQTMRWSNPFVSSRRTTRSQNTFLGLIWTRALLKLLISRIRYNVCSTIRLAYVLDINSFFDVVSHVLKAHTCFYGRPRVCSPLCQQRQYFWRRSRVCSAYFHSQLLLLPRAWFRKQLFTDNVLWLLFHARRGVALHNFLATISQQLFETKQFWDSPIRSVTMATIYFVLSTWTLIRDVVTSADVIAINLVHWLPIFIKQSHSTNLLVARSSDQ